MASTILKDMIKWTILVSYCMYTHTHTYGDICTYQHLYVHTYLLIYHTDIVHHTYVRTYIHTCKHTYIHANIHIYIHRRTCISAYLWMPIPMHTPMYGLNVHMHVDVCFVQQKSNGLKFSNSWTGSDMNYRCHHNSSCFTFLIFVHSWHFSGFHSLQLTFKNHASYI
jgi:hypothetical protein